mgnify:CR=1 FL=1
MKQISVILFFLVLTGQAFGQVAGNINFQQQIQYPEANIEVSYPSSANVFISVKGLANIKADSYVAIFNTTQAGKTTEEVNRLVNERIEKALKNIKAKSGV